MPANKHVFIDSTYGKMAVSNIQSSKIELRTRNGDVSLSNVVSSKIDVGTSLGHATLKNSKSDFLILGTDVGDCVVDQVYARDNITLEVGTGNLLVTDVSLSNYKKKLITKVFSGKTEIKEFKVGSLDAVATTGDIIAHIQPINGGKFYLQGPNVKPLTQQGVSYSTNTNNLKVGTINGGGDTSITAATSTGSIEIV
jgi:hypothetical protein